MTNLYNRLFEQLYEETNKNIYIYLIGKCSRIEDAQDLLQDIYFEVYKIICADKWINIINPTAFIMKITKRKLYKYYINTKKERERTQHPQTLDDEIEITDEAIQEISAEDIAVDILTVAEIQQKLKHLDSTTAKIFQLYFQYNLTLEKISEVLNLTPSCVKNRLYRTLHIFRKLYEVKED